MKCKVEQSFEIYEYLKVWENSKPCNIKEYVLLFFKFLSEDVLW